jgi:hypothetical protein
MWTKRMIGARVATEAEAITRVVVDRNHPDLTMGRGQVQLLPLHGQDMHLGDLALESHIQGLHQRVVFLLHLPRHPLVCPSFPDFFRMKQLRIALLHFIFLNILTNFCSRTLRKISLILEGIARMFN